MSNTINRNCKKYGYARVSSKSQEANSSLESQQQELIDNGILESNIIIEVGSVLNEIKNRFEFQNLIQTVLKEQDIQKLMNVLKVVMTVTRGKINFKSN